MKTLQTIQNELRDLVPQGNDLVLAALKKTLKPGTDKYKDYLALEGRYQDTSRQLLQGVVSNEDATLEFNKIRQAIIEFIDGLQATDIPELASTNPSEGGITDVYNGEVLYRIPKKMQVGIEEECVVRLAFDRQQLIRDFKVEVGDVMRDLRISDVMGVELLDPSSDKAFSITTVHDTVQFVEKDLVTEWIFCVTPLKQGQFSLVLKISIIEIINGIERKRNEVLKEQVEILTQRPEEEAPGFVSAGYSWQVTSASEQRAVSKGSSKSAENVEFPTHQPTTTQPAPAPMPQAPVPSRTGGGFKKIGTLLGALAALVVVVIAMRGFLGNNSGVKSDDPLVSAADHEWEGIKKRRQKTELEDFVEKYPSRPEAAIAQNMLDTLEEETWQNALAMNDYTSMEHYVQQYPNGKYAQKAALRMDEINHAVKLEVLDSQKVNIEITKPIITETESGKNQITKPSTQKPSTKPRQPNTQKPNRNPTNSGTAGTGKPTKPTRPQPETKTQPIEPSTNTKTPTNINQPVLLVSTARKPVFKNCGNRDPKKEEKCTAERIHNYLANRINYPDNAIKKGIQGKVVVGFVVEKDGSISEVKTLNQIGGGCDEEAMRLIKNLPRFTPGKNGRGEPVRVQYTQPVTFKIEK